MIEFINISNEAPYLKFIELYEIAHSKNQILIEAINISSYSRSSRQVNSRLVNLKFIDNKDFIFFSNYESDKAKEFSLHDQIAATIHWNKCNFQIRMKAKIKKTSAEFNQKYFFHRSEEKNALAISSNQSKPINSYNQVKENYNKSLSNDNLKKCPEYWGGFSFTPYYFEFWEGHESRLNKREVFNNIDGIWKHSFLQP